MCVFWFRKCKLEFSLQYGCWNNTEFSFVESVLRASFHQRGVGGGGSKLANGTGFAENSYLKIIRMAVRLYFACLGKICFSSVHKNLKALGQQQLQKKKISQSTAINIAHMCHFTDQKGLHQGTIGLFPNCKLFLSFFFFLFLLLLLPRDLCLSQPLSHDRCQGITWAKVNTKTATRKD